MRILVYELKKMMLYQKGLYFLVGFFLINTFLLIYNDYPHNDSIELYKQEYMAYMDVVNGPLDEKKQSYLENEASQISTTQLELNRLYNQYYNNEISKETFDTQEATFSAVLENSSGFQEIFQDYLYISENPENRYFVYSNGWNGLLADEQLNLLLVIVTILLTTGVFCNEYVNEMDILARTSKKGSSYAVIVKIFLTLLIISTICLASFVIKIGFYEIKYGLPNGNYPIQCVYLFRNSTKHLTLFQCLIYIHSIKLVGYLLLSLTIMFVSVCVKKQLLTVFLSSCLVCIPYLGISDMYMYYCQPLGLILATGYFKGTVYEVNGFTNEKIIFFNEIATQVVYLILIISLITMCVMTLHIYWTNINHWCKKQRPFLSILIFTLLLSGCSTSSSEDNMVIYNLSHRQAYETETTSFYYDFKHSQIAMEDKVSNTVEFIIRDPFDRYVRYDMCFFMLNDTLYYAQHNLENTPVIMENTLLRGGTCEYNFSIVALNTKTFEETIVFEENVENNRSGIIDNTYDQWLFLRMISGFFVDADNIYIIANDGLRIIDRITHEIHLISEIPSNFNVGFDGRYIYYVGDRYCLSRYDIIENKHQELDNVITDNFTVFDDRIEFTNKLDDGRLYCLEINNDDISIQSISP